jgi:hypothetical protein
MARGSPGRRRGLNSRNEGTVIDSAAFDTQSKMFSRQDQVGAVNGTPVARKRIFSNPG